MKLIDDKGRLFGRINLLDLAVMIGILAVLYVGVSAWTALRQQPMLLLEITPSRITSGKPVKVTVKLQNERYIQSARLHLISDQPGAATTTLSGVVRPSVRDQAAFTIPADLPAGNYSLELETQVLDVFHRQSLQTVRNAKLKLVVADEVIAIPVEEVKVVEVVEVVFNPKCLWKLEFKAAFLSATGEPPQLIAGNSLECRDGMILTLLEIEQELSADVLDKLPADKREKAFALAGLEVTASFEHLENLLAGLESSISLSCRDSLFEAIAIGKIFTELDMLFYLDGTSQNGLLEKKSALATDGDRATAVVLENYGQVDNPWLSAAAVQLDQNNHQAFSVARVRFESRPEKGGLFFGSTRLEPNRLLTFRPNGARISGGILGTVQPNLSTTVRVMLDNVPAHLAPLLTKGLKVTNAKGNLNGGVLKRILAIAPLAILPTTPGLKPGGIGRDFRRMLLELELECTSRNGALYFQGQQIEYGRNLNLALLGRPFAATIYHGGNLPPRGKLVWEKIQVVFRGVPVEIVPWIRTGEQEYSPGKPSTWKIERVMSNEPSKILYPSADGRQAHLTNHPISRDIRCLISLRLVSSGDDRFYNGAPLKIGTGIGFNARNWNFSASLASF